MSTSALPHAPHYTLPPPTSVELDYASLAIIDLSKYSTPAGRDELVVEIHKALSTVGFLYIINHGYSKEQTQRMFDLADIPFTQVEEDEKTKYVADMKGAGSYYGYKPRQYWHIDGGVRDQIEHYNIPQKVTSREHPIALRPFISEVEAFGYHVRHDILLPLLRLLASGLKLPENALVDCHNIDNNETWLRFMKYYPRTEEEESKSNNVWLKGHTDFGSISLLWSQPISGLQIRTQDGTWKWVKYIENALVVNAGEALEFISGGIYKATIHRVVQPPADQRALPRLGVFCFAVADEDLELVSLLPEDQKRRNQNQERPPIMGDWRRGRIRNYGSSNTRFAENEKGVEEQKVDGVLIKHYN